MALFDIGALFFLPGFLRSSSQFSPNFFLSFFFSSNDYNHNLKEKNFKRYFIPSFLLLEWKIEWMKSRSDALFFLLFFWTYSIQLLSNFSHLSQSICRLFSPPLSVGVRRLVTPCLHCFSWKKSVPVPNIRGRKERSKDARIIKFIVRLTDSCRSQPVYKANKSIVTLEKEWLS